MGEPSDLVQGMLVLLIFKTIAPAPQALTRAARKQLETELASWDRLSSATNLMVRTRSDRRCERSVMSSAALCLRKYDGN
jgi:hypothetical protein